MYSQHLMFCALTLAAQYCIWQKRTRYYSTIALQRVLVLTYFLSGLQVCVEVHVYRMLIKNITQVRIK